LLQQFLKKQISIAKNYNNNSSLNKNIEVYSKLNKNREIDSINKKIWKIYSNSIKENFSFYIIVLVDLINFFVVNL